MKLDCSAKKYQKGIVANNYEELEDTNVCLSMLKHFSIEIVINNKMLLLVKCSVIQQNS